MRSQRNTARILQKLWLTADLIAFIFHVVDNNENVRFYPTGVSLAKCGIFSVIIDGAITIVDSTPILLSPGSRLMRWHPCSDSSSSSIGTWSRLRPLSRVPSMLSKMTRDSFLKRATTLPAHCDPGGRSRRNAQRLEQFNIESPQRQDGHRQSGAGKRFTRLPTDNRRIIPTTKPSDGLVSFDRRRRARRLNLAGSARQSCGAAGRGPARLVFHLLMARNQLTSLTAQHTRYGSSTARGSSLKVPVALRRFLETFGPVPTSRWNAVEGLTSAGMPIRILYLARDWILHAGLVVGAHHCGILAWRRRARQRQVFDDDASTR